MSLEFVAAGRFDAVDGEEASGYCRRAGVGIDGIGNLSIGSRQIVQRHAVTPTRFLPLWDRRLDWRRTSQHWARWNHLS